MNTNLTNIELLMNILEDPQVFRNALANSSIFVKFKTSTNNTEILEIIKVVKGETQQDRP